MIDKITEAISELADGIFGANAGDVEIRLGLAVLILLLAWLVTRFTSRLVGFLSKRLIRTTTIPVEKLVEAFMPPVRFLAAVFGIWLAWTVLNVDVRFERTIDQAFSVLVLLAVFWAMHRSVDILVDALESQKGRIDRLDANLIRFMRQVGKALVIIFAFVIIMQELGYNLNALLTGLGIGGLAVALAAQDAISNLIGYFVIMADSPFHIGDYVVTRDAEGVVEGIGFRSTRIRRLDQSLVYVPNSILAGSSLTNWSRLEKRRLNMSLDITYGSSPEQILAVVTAIRAMLNNHEQVINDTAIVQFVSFKDSSLEIMVICFLKTPAWGDFQATKEDINLRIMQILTEHGVEFAFPTQTVFIEQAVPFEDRTTRRPMPIPAVEMEPPAEPAIGPPVPPSVPPDAANEAK
jgi:MscS family membrane protein